MEQNNQPLNLAFEQAKDRIANAINVCLRENQIPPFMMEIILRDFLVEVRHQAQLDLQNARMAYK